MNDTFHIEEDCSVFWERWYVMLDAVRCHYNDGDIREDEPFLTEELLEALYRESFCTDEAVFRQVPIMEEKVVSDIGRFVGKTLPLIAELESLSVPGCILKHAERLAGECRLIAGIIDWFNEIDAAAGEHVRIFEQEDLKDIHGKLNGVCFEDMSLRDFTVALDNGMDPELLRKADYDYYRIREEDVSFTPTGGHPFAFWVFRQCVSAYYSSRYAGLKFGVNPKNLVPSSFPDWVEDSFRDFQDYEEMPNSLHSTEEAGMLENLLGRPVFDGLCTREGVRALNGYKNPADEFTLMTHITNLSLRPDGEESLLKLLHLLTEETLFWERNIENFSRQFVSSWCKKSRLNERKYAKEVVDRISDNIHSLYFADRVSAMKFTYSGTAYPQAIPIMMKESERCRDKALLCGEPLFSEEGVRDFLAYCIRGNFETAQAIRGFLTDRRLCQGSRMSETEERFRQALEKAGEYGYVDERSNVRSGCRVKLANLLVSMEVVRPDTDWRHLLAAYPEDGGIGPEEVKEISRRLNFRAVDGLFNEGYEKIQKAFVNENRSFVPIILELVKKHRGG